jgi:signal transduction histidine kinase
MLKSFALKTHIMLALLITLASLLCFWLGQQFSTTLVQFTASQLLEQERAYLQPQLDKKPPIAVAATLDHATSSTNLIDAIAPSRPYFSLQHDDITRGASALAHDNNVFALTSNNGNAARYAAMLMPATQNEPSLWLILDLEAALPLSDFLQLLQVVCAVLVLLFAGAALTLVYRLSNAQQLLASAMQREQAFVNDISHELRTPLAIVQNAFNLYGNAPLSSESLTVAKAAITSMAQQLQVLLALARKKQTAAARLSLVDQLEQAMFTLYQSEPDFVSKIELAIPESVSVIANPQLIQLLLLNIISNACHHSGGAILYIAWQDNSLQFTNHIQLQIDGSVANSNRHQGFGHGSSLIQRIANELAWPIEIVSSKTRYQISIGIK